MTPDPFDALRQPDAPVAPNPAFASALRRRLADLLDLDQGAPMSDTTSRTALAARPLRPYLIVAGAARAIEFYAAAFGAVVVGEAFVDDDGRIGHAELDIAGAGLYLADEYPEVGALAPQPGAGNAVALHLEVADADAVAVAAVAAGATLERPVEDRGYGRRGGSLVDPFGHRWMLDAPLAEPITEEEIRRRMADEGFTLETVDLGDRAPASRPAEPVPAEPATVELAYFTIDAPDGVRATAFYGALFGWATTPGGQPDGFHITNVEPPGGISGGAAIPDTTLWFGVVDLAAAAARVLELGGQVLTEVSYADGASVSCVDDQGVAFQLWKMTSREI